MHKGTLFLTAAAALLCCLFSCPVSAEEGDVTVKAEVPYREDSGLTRAEYYLAKEKYAEALEEAEAVLKRHPSSADAYTYAGLAYLNLGDEDKAQSRFKKAIAANPTHLGANKYLADIYIGKGDLARALEQMQVLRMTCDDKGCPELLELQASLNKAKKKKKSDED